MRKLKYSSPIMIVGINIPNFDEISYLISQLTSKKKLVIDKQTFYLGRINHQPIVIAHSGIGSNNASIITTIGINHFHPKYVISEGTSGAHNTFINVNDIILGKNILDITSYYGDLFEPNEWKLLGAILHDDIFLLKKAMNTRYKKGLVKLGTLASSNCWNTSSKFIKKLHNKFHEECEEMESYAVANVCEIYQIPHLSIRIISNNLLNKQPYDKNAGLNCRKYTLDVIKELMK